MWYTQLGEILWKKFISRISVYRIKAANNFTSERGGVSLSTENIVYETRRSSGADLAACDLHLGRGILQLTFVS